MNREKGDSPHLPERPEGGHRRAALVGAQTGTVPFFIPWFHQGLNFACTGCGDCCTGEPGYVWVNKAEIQTLAAALDVSVQEFQDRYVRTVGIRKSLVELARGDCVFFDNRRRSCRVYEARPRQCRTWPFWPSNLSSPAAWAQTQRRCPGCNAGPLVPPKQIIAQLQTTRG